ncbi:response regulator [Candidatus Peregrinibacteria bacterium]|nr:response regulator [Candidatus Peregrinibacteria bacterium]
MNSSTSQTPSDRRKRVLVVDDDPDSRNAYVDILSVYGYVVDVACDALQALEIIGKDEVKHDLIVTDNNMPRMTGRQMVTRLKDDGETVPVLMISGDHEVELKQWARDAGVTFIPKPIDFDRFLDGVQTLLAHH